MNCQTPNLHIQYTLYLSFYNAALNIARSKKIVTNKLEAQSFQDKKLQ
jgi:hypothetical protein